MIGGVLVDRSSWRWIFFVNLPVGVVAVALALAAPARGAARGRRSGSTCAGSRCSRPGIAIFVYGISEAGTQGGFGDAGDARRRRRSALALVGAVRPARARARGQRRAARPHAASAARLRDRRGDELRCSGVALFGALILLPLYYQLVRGESALATGLLLVPQGLGAALAMPLAGG